MWDKVLVNWICFGVMVMPWVMYPMDNIKEQFRAPKLFFYDIICFGIIFIAFNKEPIRKYTNKYLSWLLAWLFFIIAFTLLLPFSQVKASGQQLHLWTLMPTLQYFITIFAAYILLTNLKKEDFSKIAKAICYSALLVSVIAILQALGLKIEGNKGFYNHPNHAVAFLDNPLLFGNYLCLAFPFFFMFNDKKIKWLSLFVVAGIIISNSQISWIVALAEFLILLFLIHPKIKFMHIGTLITIGLGAILFIQKIKPTLASLFGQRLDCWKQAIPFLKRNPIFGQGLGVFKTFRISTFNTGWQEAHNDWFEWAICAGLMGAFFLVLVIINSFRNFNYKNMDKLNICYLVSFISFLLLMGGSFVMEIAPLAFIGLLTFCFMEINKCQRISV